VNTDLSFVADTLQWTLIFFLFVKSAKNEARIDELERRTRE
jgi:hypothetical protein